MPLPNNWPKEQLLERFESVFRWAVAGTATWAELSKADSRVRVGRVEKGPEWPNESLGCRLIDGPGWVDLRSRTTVARARPSLLAPRGCAPGTTITRAHHVRVAHTRHQLEAPARRIPADPRWHVGFVSVTSASSCAQTIREALEISDIAHMPMTRYLIDPTVLIDRSGRYALS